MATLRLVPVSGPAIDVGQGPEHGRAGPELRDRRDRRLRLAPPRPAREARRRLVGGGPGQRQRDLRQQPQGRGAGAQEPPGAPLRRPRLPRGPARGPGGHRRDAVPRRRLGHRDGALDAPAHSARGRASAAADADPEARRLRRPCRTPPPLRPRLRRAPPPRRSASARAGPAAPVPQMPGGRAAREEGQEPALLGRDRLLRVPAPRGCSSPASSAAASSWPRRARPTPPTPGSGTCGRARPPRSRRDDRGLPHPAQRRRRSRRSRPRSPSRRTRPSSAAPWTTTGRR